MLILIGTLGVDRTHGPSSSVILQAGVPSWISLTLTGRSDLIMSVQVKPSGTLRIVVIDPTSQVIVNVTLADSKQLIIPAKSPGIYRFGLIPIHIISPTEVTINYEPLQVSQKPGLPTPVLVVFLAIVLLATTMFVYILRQTSAKKWEPILRSSVPDRFYPL